MWNGLRTQPILTDEVQTFKALILVHKLLQEGHPVVSFEPCEWGRGIGLRIGPRIVRLRLPPPR